MTALLLACFSSGRRCRLRGAQLFRQPFAARVSSGFCDCPLAKYLIGCSAINWRAGPENQEELRLSISELHDESLLRYHENIRVQVEADRQQIQVHGGRFNPRLRGNDFAGRWSREAY